MWRENLEAIRQEVRIYGQELNNGISEKEANMFAKTVKKEMKVVLPQQYLDALKDVNGLEYNGIILYGMDEHLLNKEPNQHINGLIENNDIWNENEWDTPYLFLGEGDISWYAYNPENKKYYELDNPSGDVMKEFESFDLLFVKMLEDALM